MPHKKARKPPVVLSRQDIRRVIDTLPEPTKSIVTLIVVGSLRIGEVAALRWKELTRIALKLSSDSMKASLTTPKLTPDAGAFRLIPLEFCEVFWNRLGSGRSAETQVIWCSPTYEEDR
ncbi:MAG: hypothetical protein WCB11_09110 [Terriglobales bacterium]